MDLAKIGYALIAIAILLVLYSFFTRKSASRYYKKALKAHKMGEKYYNIGDSELADEYYEEAEHFRKKAEELGGVF